MLPKEERESIIRLMHEQVVPAVGCTEPIAVALCVAKARELLGTMPERVQLRLSANIVKNAMGVGIPGTGMIGLPIAVALGVLIGKSEYLLEVLKDSNKEAVARGRQFIDEGRIDIALEEEDPDKLYIRVLCLGEGHESEAIIKGHHTHFAYLRLDGDVLLDERHHVQEDDEQTCVPLTLRKVFDFATTTDIEEIRFILDAKRLNEAASADGLRENYGHQLGCDARMAGAMIPVMSNSGSGNQGICATMPVVVFAEENHNTEEELIRALTLSNLAAIYMKQSLGSLSALCGCVVASTGSSCGITLLMGGGYDEVCWAVKNMIANLTGMICDGAKPSCALKLTTGVGTAVLSAMLAIQHKHVTSVEGIIDDDVDQSIRNLTAIGSRGMDVTDRYVLDIMTHKK